VCKCVLYYCHRVSTQLQLNISYIVSYHVIPYHIIPYIISYHIISYHTISYHIVSYHIPYHTNLYTQNRIYVQTYVNTYLYVLKRYMVFIKRYCLNCCTDGQRTAGPSSYSGQKPSSCVLTFLPPARFETSAR